MGEMNNNPYLNLSEDEIQKVLLMDNVELNNFLKDRKIDFSKPTLLKTPDGVAEPWMNSPEDIKTFLAKCHSN